MNRKKNHERYRSYRQNWVKAASRESHGQWVRMLLVNELYTSLKAAENAADEPTARVIRAEMIRRGLTKIVG